MNWFKRTKFLEIAILLFTLILCSSCTLQAQDINREMLRIEDSLDMQSLPVPVCQDYNPEVVLRIANQKQWDKIGEDIRLNLQKGYRNICVQVETDKLELYPDINGLENLNYPEANIKICGNGVTVVPSGEVIYKGKGKLIPKKTHYAAPLSKFSINNVLLDKKHHALSLYGPSFYIDSTIEPVESEGTLDVLNPDGSLYKVIKKTWRFKTELPDINNEQCHDFYILLTRDWTSCRHKVVKVEDGYLYFNLKSDDAPTPKQITMDPNSDMKSYKTNPRCRLLNSPVGSGLYFKSDTLFVPNSVNQIRIGRGGRLFLVKNSHLKSLEISGFHVVGAGNFPCVLVQSSSFSDQMWIKDNIFANLSYSAIQIMSSDNVSISNNEINNTRLNAIYCNGNNISIFENKLKNIGYMAQTMAVSFSGTNIHVFMNTIEDFNYCAIGTGGTQPNSQCPPKTYIIERNTIRYTSGFFNNLKNNTLADGGGIYIGPQNTQGIIRYNVIENITGTGANRGIFLDDGAKNLSIYGNLIMNTMNSYDIDLRLCNTYAEGIPDYNTKNSIFHNILTGGYRFEDKGTGSNCIGGENYLLGTGMRRKTIISLKHNHRDNMINGCRYQNGKMIIPRKYAAMIDSAHIDGFVKNYLVFR